MNILKKLFGGEKTTDEVKQQKEKEQKEKEQARMMNQQMDIDR